MNEHLQVSILDHSYLEVQGLPIKQFYKQELVDLAREGVSIFSNNLHRSIIQVVKKDGLMSNPINQRIHYNQEGHTNWEGHANKKGHHDQERRNNRN